MYQEPLIERIDKKLGIFKLVLFCLTMITLWTCKPASDLAVPKDKTIDEGVNSYVFSQDSQALITQVIVSGSENNYSFSVQIKSPDTGCEQYADWWEVFTMDSILKYRRILAHSHVGEQPFSRSGGPIDVVADEMIFIRGHVNNFGYGSLVYTGTIEAGLVPDTLRVNFAASLEAMEPLPTDCAF